MRSPTPVSEQDIEELQGLMSGERVVAPALKNLWSMLQWPEGRNNTRTGNFCTFP